VGDQIIGVDGVDAREWSIDQARDSIRGAIGTMVDLAIAREGLAEPITLPIRRDQVHVSAVAATSVHDSLGYILVDRVARGSAAEVDSAFAVLDDAKGIILDLRRNPGGYLVESLSMADLFLKRGQAVASTRSRAVGQPNQMSQETYQARLPERIPAKPIVVLVDRYTASAAEIVAGALQDHDRALVVGERTFGKGVVQTVLPIPGDRRIRITTGSWHTPLGRSLHIPRDAEGRPIDEETDTFPVIATRSGRNLRADGGVYPDLLVRGDTLSTPEQELLIAAARAGVPLNVRIIEFALEEARKGKAGTGAVELPPEAVERFIQALGSEGVPAEALEHPDARAYLSWRTRIAFAERIEHHHHALEFRAERDTVLAEALRLLEGVDSQEELFVAAEARAAQLEEAESLAILQGGGS
jgi:carboxyl-terminal processing protease